MLNPQDLTQVLSQANTGGVQSTLLVNNEGSLVAFSGYGDTNVNVKAAITSSIWSAYEKSGSNALSNENLQFMLLDCDDGRVVMTRVASLILCLFAEKSVNVGMLKAKADALTKYLSEPLKNLALVT
ncbi:ragulator complex protein LAMTOR2-like [Styela clava]|uniref:ragulator complex protein LAMTOR2-like n=1 Tax=Styela clava TaxID=7725 RepID=UPI001939C298|nr:ragulator complex protein LAMTOR2-like [Styela clava]